MSVQGRSLGQISQQFADHLNRILNTTVSRQRLSVFMPDAQNAYLGFRQPTSVSGAPIQTSYGSMQLDLRQICDAVPDGGSGALTLRTLSYRYTITPESATEPLLRWEFVRFPANSDAIWCKHHFQGPIRMGIHNRDGEEATLNRWHLPTSEVAVEEVLRFCIADLGVRPLSDEWDQVQRESDEQR